MDLFQWLKNACGGKEQPAGQVLDLPHTPPARRRYRFSGHVQGVGFRYEAMVLAEQLELTGWARNERDGTVTVEIEGEVGHIDAFLQGMEKVSRFHITDIQREDLPLSGAETAFQVRY